MPSRLLSACLILTAVTLAGCSVDTPEQHSTPPASSSPLPAVDAVADADALSKVQWTAEPGKAPVLRFTPPIKVTAPVARIVQPGTGDAITLNSAVVVDVVTINGSDGSSEGSTYGKKPQLLIVDEVNLPVAMLELLVGAQTGAQVLLAGPADDARTTLWAFEIRSVLDVPVQATGAAVDPPAGLPLIGYADSGTANGQMPMMVPIDAPPPTGLVAQPLIVGNGEKVRADSNLVIQVAGWLWDGTQFQNSWEEGPGVPVVLSGTIRGWREGLLGQTVGSQVLLVVPPAMAWGDEGRGDLIPAGSTLVYVIDILVGI